MKTYDLNEVVVVKSKEDIDKWCKQHGITREEFNQPIAIAEGVTSCTGMLHDCTLFNQPIVIPEGVTTCFGMLSDCKSFNQSLTFKTTVLESCVGMLSGCESFDKLVVIPRSVTSCYEMFLNCTNLNKPIKVPENAVSDGMFKGCPGEYDEDTRTYTPNNPDIKARTSLFC